MALKYLMDENVTPIYATQLRRKRSDLVVWSVGDIGTRKVHSIQIFWFGVRSIILF